MNVLIKNVRTLFRLAPFCAAISAWWSCQGHDWPVHELITLAAYQSSSGLTNFLDTALVDLNFPLTNRGVILEIKKNFAQYLTTASICVIIVGVAQTCAMAKGGQNPREYGKWHESGAPPQPL